MGKNTNFNLYLIFLLVLFFSISRLGITKTKEKEKLLIKGNAIYLGWKINETEFMDCDENIIPIDNGSIEDTPQRCEKPGMGLTSCIGTFKSFDESKNSITLKENNKDSCVVSLPDVKDNIELDNWNKLKDIKEGEHIQIKYFSNTLEEEKAKIIIIEKAEDNE